MNKGNKHVLKLTPGSPLKKTSKVLEIDLPKIFEKHHNFFVESFDNLKLDENISDDVDAERERKLALLEQHEAMSQEKALSLLKGYKPADLKYISAYFLHLFTANNNLNK